MSRFLRVLKNSSFWICVGSIVILNFISLYIVAGNIFTYKRGFINLFLLPKVYTTNNVGFLLPIIPFLFLFSKRNKLEIDGMKRYLVSALCAPIMFAFAYLLEVSIYFVMDPSVKALAFPPAGLFSFILETDPLGYIYLYILHSCAWGWILTLFGLAVYQRTRNQFYAVVMAFLVSRLSVYIPIVFGQVKILAFGYIIPQLPFEISQMEDSWVKDLIQMAVVFIISIILIKNKKEIEHIK